MTDLVGKLIVHGRSRPECLMRLRRALDEFVVDGIELDRRRRNHIRLVVAAWAVGVALVTLDPDAMAGWAEENGMGGKSYTEIVRSDEVQKMVGDYVDELNSHLNRWETIKTWKLLDHDLTVESGELTPSMKVKRNVVQDNNQALIDEMYA